MRSGYHPAIKDEPGKSDLKAQGFYHSSEWRRLRRQALERDHYLCQACLRKHKIKRATEVHHIKSVRACPDLRLTLSNLESLCWDCHEQTKQHGAKPELPTGVRIIKIKDGTDKNLKE